MKEVREIEVCVGRQAVPAGTLHFANDGKRQQSVFRYRMSWLERADSFALAPDLPLTDSPHARSGRGAEVRTALPGALADAAPDSWGRRLRRKALGRWASELDHLLLASDETRQGALRFRDERGGLCSRQQRDIPEPDDLARVRWLVDLWENDPDGVDEASVRELADWIGSLGGARPKAGIRDSGGLYLAKFTSVCDTRPVARLEVATLQLAGAAGIGVPPARLAMGRTARPVAVITRFDRRAEDRIPYLSARSLLGMGHEGGGWHTDILDAMLRHAPDPAREMEELHRRLMFSILVSNTDNHLQNIGFLYAGQGRWRLAPAFDINPQPDRERQLKTGIAEEYGRDASIEAAVEAAPYFDLDEDRALASLRAMVSVIRDQWEARLRGTGLTGREIAACRAAFEHDETVKAGRMTAARVAASR